MVIGALLSGALGMAFGWLFSENYIWGISLLGIIFVAGIICCIIIAFLERKFNILRMVRKDKKFNRNYAVIRFGLGMSRPLFLSGKNFERMQIGNEVLEAIKAYPKDKLFFGSLSRAGILLQAQFLIEDCGWSLYMSGVKNNIEQAKKNIKSGLLKCAEYKNHNDELFTLIFRGIRHLLGIYLYSFSDSKLADLSKNDEYKNYEREINFYGELLGFLLGDTTMYPNGKSFEDFLEMFRQLIIPERSASDNINELFEEFYSWMQKKNEDKTDEIIIQSHEFRAQYFLEKFRLEYCKRLPQLRQESRYLTEQERRYLKFAQDNALILIFISSESNSDTDFLEEMSFIREPESIMIYKSLFGQRPNIERLAQGYILLGTSLMELNSSVSMEHAENLFLKGLSKSNEIDQISTYIQAQRKRITVIHRRYKLEAFGLAKELKKSRIKEDLRSMKDIESMTIKRIGFKDHGVSYSLKEKRRFYHREQRSCK